MRLTDFKFDSKYLILSVQSYTLPLKVYPLDKIRILGKILSKNEPEIGQDVKMSAKYDNVPEYTFTVENN